MNSAIKSGKQFDEIEARLIQTVIDDLKRDDSFDAEVRNAMAKSIEDETKELMSFEGNFDTEILNINSLILASSHVTKSNYRYITYVFEKRDTSIQKYFERKIIRNIDLSLTEYVQANWREYKKRI